MNKYLIVTVYVRDDIRDPHSEIVEANTPAQALTKGMKLMFSNLTKNDIIQHSDCLWEYRGDTRTFAHLLT